MSIDTVLLVVAAICFGLAVLNVAAPINLVAAGLLAWLLTDLLP